MYSSEFAIKGWNLIEVEIFPRQEKKSIFWMPVPLIKQELDIKVKKLKTKAKNFYG